MKLIVAYALILILLSVLGAGYLAVRGIGSAAGWTLEWLQPVVSRALPPGSEPERLRERLDQAIVLVREGRVDGAAVRETLLWLPGALLDGQMDASETEALGVRLERLIGPASPDATSASGG